MITTNISNQFDLETNYSNGLLPQRNQKNIFYQESSSRSNLANFTLSSENRRILRKIDHLSFQKIPLSKFQYTNEVQKTIHAWVKGLGWDFPTSSIKTVFTRHIFNHIFIWKDQKGNDVGYVVCLYTPKISHLAYAFYDPKYSHDNLPIGMVLQGIVDSHNQNLSYCYLGRFSENTGFYKRNMPGFEYFVNNSWQQYNK